MKNYQQMQFRSDPDIDPDLFVICLSRGTISYHQWVAKMMLIWQNKTVWTSFLQLWMDLVQRKKIKIPLYNKFTR